MITPFSVRETKLTGTERRISLRHLVFPFFLLSLYCFTPSSKEQATPARAIPEAELKHFPSFLEKYNLALVSPENFPESIEDDLKEILLRSERASIVDRKKTADALNELSLQQTGITDKNNSLRLGKILSVQKLIYLKEQNGRYSLELLDIETSKSEFLRSFKREGSEKVFNELTGYLTQNLLLKNLNGLKPKNKNIKIELSSSKSNYHTNEPVQFTVRSSEDCYIYLILLQSDGETLLLFPNSYNSNNFLRSNTDLLVPDGKTGYILAAGEPYGKDSIKVIASKSQLNLFQTKPYGDSPFGKIERPFESVSRGIKLIQTNVADGEWNIAETEIITKEN
ncbi:DUF4384 domain-containing protein [Leptospira venezuelensis]|uniref:DUF4384 domain-containing protein n=1 Tax=Leptospira venezuelensis TaxID=1958811 RepID=UPI000A3A5133|nr:DUF4384 domain-containing protein [Leptospira venezuelensis]